MPKGMGNVLIFELHTLSALSCERGGKTKLNHRHYDHNIATHQKKKMQ